MIVTTVLIEILSHCSDKTPAEVRESFIWGRYCRRRPEWYKEK